MLVKSYDRSWRALSILTFSLVLAACGGGGDGTREAAPDGANENEAGAAASEVAIENFTFVPGEIQVAGGTTVNWTNQDENAHTVMDEGGAGFEESSELEQGESFSFTYDTPGTYPYICGIHPYMKGTVVVS